MKRPQQDKVEVDTLRVGVEVSPDVSSTSHSSRPVTGSLGVMPSMTSGIPPAFIHIHTFIHIHAVIRYLTNRTTHYRVLAQN